MSKTRAAPNFWARPAGEAVDAALASDVLAEDEHVGAGREGVGQCGVDRLRERERPGVLGQATTEDAGTLRGGGRGRRGRAAARGEGGHDLLATGQRGGVGELDGEFLDQLADLVVALGQSAGAEVAGVGEQRIAVAVGGQCGGRPVAGLHVGAGVAEIADRAQVQQRRPPVATHRLGQLARRRAGRTGLVAVGAEVADSGTLRRARHPALRGRYRDADAVVLAHEQQRQRQALGGAVARGVQRSDCGGVVQRGVAERADGDRVVGPPGRDVQPLGARDRERHPDRARQVRGDGRGLRDHGQLGVAPHLVPPARGHVRGAGEHAEQNCPHRLVQAAAGEQGAGEEEAAGTVVQQGRVGGAQRRRDERVRLVARPSRWCRSRVRARASGGRGCRAAGWPPSRRRS